MSLSQSNRPLFGSRVMVTRPAHLAHHLAQSLENQGATVIRFPCMEIIATEKTQEMYEKVQQLERYNLLVFISQNAVDYGVKLLREAGKMKHSVPVVAVGIKTSEALARAGIANATHPLEVMSSEALAETELVKSITKGRVLIFRGQGGNDYLAMQLCAQGAGVDYLEVYSRQCPQTPLQFSANCPAPDLITVASAETLKNLYALVVPDALDTLLKIPVVVGSARMEQTHQQLGFKYKPMIARSPLDDDMLQAVLDWWKITRTENGATTTNPSL